MISPAVSQTLSHSKKGRDQVDRRTARLAAAVPAARSKIGALLLSLGVTGSSSIITEHDCIVAAGRPRVGGICMRIIT